MVRVRPASVPHRPLARRTHLLFSTSLPTPSFCPHFPSKKPETLRPQSPASLLPISPCSFSSRCFRHLRAPAWFPRSTILTAPAHDPPRPGSRSPSLALPSSHFHHLCFLLPSWSSSCPWEGISAPLCSWNSLSSPAGLPSAGSPTASSRCQRARRAH